MDEAHVEGGAMAAPKETFEWSFAEPQPGWEAYVPPWRDEIAPVTTTRVDGALRVQLDAANRSSRYNHDGWLFVDLPDLKPEDWAYLVVRMRTGDKLRHLAVAFDHPTNQPGFDYPSLLTWGRLIRPVDDGEVHSYTVTVGTTEGAQETWPRLGLQFASKDPASFDLLSVTLVPAEAAFTATPAGVSTEARDGDYRRVLYTHAPARLEYPVQVPAGGRLDFGMGVLYAEPAVTFRVTAAADGDDDGETLFEESYADRAAWAQRSVDLSSWAGRVVQLGLSAETADGRNVALWAAPTLSGTSPQALERPNVILYIIDGGAAEFMSLYNYNRRTTPNLARLAAAGALFVNAYSTATWTKPSTMSFMTSLTPGMLGGYLTPGDPLPPKAVPMGELMHRAGYQTAHFTANPFCGTMSSLDRGMDAMRETISEGNSVSSQKLHEIFWQWREDYPGEPYWVHFQTIDVHPPYEPVNPFAGLHVNSERREAGKAEGLRLRETEQAMAQEERGDDLVYQRKLFERAGVDPHAYSQTFRDAYDEAMAHNDYQIGKLVERLQATGQWERTLLIVAADHGWDHVHQLMEVENPQPRGGLMLNPYLSRVPMLFVWPEHIAAGLRFEQPVSMLDLLPTVLDLVGQPKGEHLVGQSLAPLLQGREGWEPRPVILEETMVDPETGEVWGLVEVIDGRWGAGLQIGNYSEDERPPTEEDRLLVYDLWHDPFCQQNINDERPDLVKKYRDLLEKTFREHLAVAEDFPREDQLSLNNDQLEQLRSLGYLQ
jgi:arylsulfatase A-like enzyme